MKTQEETMPVNPAMKSGHQMPEHTQNTVFAEGFWADETAVESLWSDCLAGRTTGGGFLAKLEATARLFGYRRAARPWSLANIAWFNGATAFFEGAPLRAVLAVAGEDREADGRALLKAVLGVRGVAGREAHALWDQRALLTRAFEDGGFGSPPTDAGLGAALVAGWLAAEDDHLVTHRAYQQDLTRQSDWMLMGQLVRAAAGCPDMQFDEALARVIASDYTLQERLEAGAVGRAVELSLAACRAAGWGVCGFLREGIAHGEWWVQAEPAAVAAVLVELEERLTAQEQIFELLFDGGIGRASDATGWRKMVTHWTPYKTRGAHRATDRGTALQVLRHAYDGLFWFGATREMNRQHGTTERWMAAHAEALAAVAVETKR
jgi:hypothetical protein